MQNKGLLFLALLFIGLGFWIALAYWSTPVQIIVFEALSRGLTWGAEHTEITAGVLCVGVVLFFVRWITKSC